MSPRLPRPRDLAPGYPRDRLDRDEVAGCLQRHGNDSDVDAVIRRLTAAQTLIAALEGFRQQKGVPLSHLAQRLSVSSDTVERIFAGRTWPAADLLLLISEELERPLRYTIDGFDSSQSERRAEVAKRRAERDAQRAADEITRYTADAIVARLRDDDDLWRRVAEMLRPDRGRRES